MSTFGARIIKNVPIVLLRHVSLRAVSLFLLLDSKNVAIAFISGFPRAEICDAL